ncbi:toxin-antitoxin system HicB family antitoxin [Actinosynnema sp. NPDC047251]|uniref:HicB family protein n=1 Tax=Saccharothrix espanaensis (strain ATCC 51144 / DSM 44229 / JCM 9112 / NBRC 15066 / NRRL 15764) TaxID=1179773 RepID=K0K1U5_SACES|nr:toxin-antitoxin system HicB family antitoxin [Saccharothrix espanaensis]CCH34195.1 HicB family protein [Saccharothrix espanaensis DSM 44229]
MDLSPYIAQLREDLATAASAGDEDTRRTAAVLSAALEPAARLALMNALSDLAAEVTAALDGPVVDVRLDGRDVQVVVTGASTPREDHEPQPQEVPRATAGSEATRITLRLLDELKSKAEQAAASQGLSLNTFVAQAVQGAVGGRRGHHKGPWPESAPKPPKDGGSRVNGWVQG